MIRASRLFLSTLTMATATLLCAPVSWAETISFQVSDPDLSAPSGGVATFTGTVTNNSGADLTASSFFFIFFGFDPAGVTLKQDLGVATDFPIANGTTSATTPLFSATLGAVPEGASFPIQAQLEDINFDSSVPQTVTVSASGPVATVPEPSALLLFLIGAVLVVLLSRFYRLMTDRLPARPPHELPET